MMDIVIVYAVSFLVRIPTSVALNWNGPHDPGIFNAAVPDKPALLFDGGGNTEVEK
jgi:hypothetical protein